MILFLVAGVPVLCRFLFIFDKTSSRKAVLAYLKGLIWFLPALAVFLLLRGLFTLHFTASGLYTYYLVHDYLLPVSLGMAGCLLVFNRSGSYGQNVSLPETLMFFGGYFTLFGVLELILHFRWFDIQVLFLRPAAFIVLILFCASMAYLAFEQEGYRRVLLIAGTIAGAAFPAFIPMVFRLAHPLMSIAICGALLAGSAFFFVKTRETARY